MPRSMAIGLIGLIPKSEGILDDIRKWRPIIFLNTIYNFFAKTLSLRLQPLLDDLIRVSQTGFIQERSIMDNQFFFGRLLPWLARKKKIELFCYLIVKKPTIELFGISFVVLL